MIAIFKEVCTRCLETVVSNFVVLRYATRYMSDRTVMVNNHYFQLPVLDT